MRVYDDLRNLRNYREGRKINADCEKRLAAIQKEEDEDAGEESDEPPSCGGTGSPARPEPRSLYADYKGRFVLVGEWVIVTVRVALDARAKLAGVRGGKKKRPKLVKENATGNLILALARLASWSEQEREDQPPRADAKYRQRDEEGSWWLMHASAVLGRQIGLGKRATQTALDKLVELGIIEIKGGR